MVLSLLKDMVTTGSSAGSNLLAEQCSETAAQILAASAWFLPANSII
jgi:hypothetical protein